MTAAEQHREVARLMARLQAWQLRLRDRASDGPELVDELMTCANALEMVATDARKLADRLELESCREAEESHAAQ